jgi:ABC-type bacteriocin/lantibiotic exporter with double-glycine peptidase domain
VARSSGFCSPTHSNRRPKIQFLDEGTAHLDVEMEQRINATLQRLKITRVAAAHRPEMIKASDRIVTLAGNRIERRSAAFSRRTQVPQVIRLRTQNGLLAQNGSEGHSMVATQAI